MGALRLTGIGIRKDVDGNTFPTRNINTVTSALITSNDFKKNEKDPDNYFYLQANQKNTKQSDNIVHNYSHYHLPRK